MAKIIVETARTELLRAVGHDLGRELSARTVLFHQAIADHLKLGIADLKCLDYLMRGTSATAGELAELTGLTTGAITGVIDRLEGRGFVQRERTPDDRRKVLVRPVKGKQMTAVINSYERLGAAMAQLAETYSDAELEVIVDFSQRCIEILKRETKKVGS